jgi:hypothetical protein
MAPRGGTLMTSRRRICGHARETRRSTACVRSRWTKAGALTAGTRSRGTRWRRAASRPSSSGRAGRPARPGRGRGGPRGSRPEARTPASPSAPRSVARGRRAAHPARPRFRPRPVAPRAAGRGGAGGRTRPPGCDHEERRPRPGVGQQVEEAPETRLEPGREARPLVHVEVEALVPVLDVDGEDVDGRGHRERVTRAAPLARCPVAPGAAGRGRAARRASGARRTLPPRCGRPGRAEPRRRGRGGWSGGAGERGRILRGTSRPVTPAATASVTPPTAVATTGVPIASASQVPAPAIDRGRAPSVP